MQWTGLNDCCSTSTLVLGGLVTALVVYLIKNKRPRNFPPGPHGLPLVGYAPFLGKNPAASLMPLKKKFGSVMSVQMGHEDWVVLNDFDAIQEALVKRGEIFSGRPKNPMLDLFVQGKGIVLQDYGPIWKDLRKFGLVTLRGFGVGKKGLEENVIEETSYLVEYINSDEKGDLKHKVSSAVSNVICRLIFGSRFEYDDKVFAELITTLNSFFNDSWKAAVFGLLVFAPFLRHIPPFSGVIKGAKKEIQEFLDLLETFIDQHRSVFDENDLRDFIDVFLKQIKQKGKDDPSFNVSQLLQYIRDLFEAGTSTTSATLLWSLFTFAHYPEIQVKVSDEVISVIGDSGTPTMKHRDQMPYTCAFIQEVMRVKTLVPLSVFHKTNEDVVFRGYSIPKNTTISPNLWAVHYDPDHFENPEEFRPERFIDSEGSFVKSNHVIPFSVGPRHCLGEQLARMEVFIFLTSIVQKLKVSPDPDFPLPPYDECAASNGVTFEPPDFKIKLGKR